MNVEWLEIPAVDHDRAIKFYSTIFDTKIEKGEMAGFPYSMLPGQVGAITTHEDWQPSTSGTTVYLSAGDDLQVVLDRVTDAGGEIAVPKTSTGQGGYFALFHDTEGNRVGLFSQG